MPLTYYNALLVADKPGLEGLMNIYLKQAGISSFTVAHSLREAVTKASQTLPHVIIVYEDTPDAKAIQIIEAIRKQPALNRALIFMVKACSQEELLRSVQLKVAAVISKTNDPNAFIEKIKQKLQLLGELSPYALRGDSLQGGSQASIKVPLKIVGKIDDHVVCLTPVNAKPGTTVSIHPDDKTLANFTVTFASSNNEQTPDGNYRTYFSLNGIMGQGRVWLQEKLPSLPVESNSNKRRLLVFERQRERAEPLQKMLKFHDIECEHVDTISNLCNVYRVSPEEFGAVYFSETLIGSVAIPWDKLKKELVPDKVPVEITATTASSPLALPRVVWLQKPFGIEQVVQSFNSAVVSVSKPKQANSAKPIPCNCMASVKIIALDEGGGILLSNIAPSTNTEFIIDHPFINANSVFGNAKVVSSEAYAANPAMSIIRFLFSVATSSKEKYWNSVYPILEAIRVAAPAAVGVALAAAAVPRPAGVAPAAAAVPRPAGAAPAAAAVPRPAGAAPAAAAVPRPAGVAPAAAVPRPAGVAPAAAAVPRPAGVAPAAGAVPRPAGVAPAAGAVPRPAGVAPAAAVPRPAGVAPAAGAVPRPAGVAPAAGAVPRPAGVAPAAATPAAIAAVSSKPAAPKT